MRPKPELNTRRHSVFKLQYHLILISKYRHEIINKDIETTLKESISNTLNKWDCKLLEFGNEKDHIHLLIEAHPSLDLSKLINNIKTVSSRKVRKEYTDYLKQYYWTNSFYSPSYFIISSGGAPIEIIKKYIQNQKNK